MTAAQAADVEAVRAYAAHVKACGTCKKANTDGELCSDGGALWDVVCGDDSDCRARATIAMFEVIGATLLIPLGVYCQDHWATESARYLAAGGRTAMTVLKVLKGDPPAACMWIRPESPCAR